ncbi:hypothetical protein BGZ83_001245 [Gryganskiella cystojenkinii]|nr:hypothetical protein BGZ83_001245 [Gryganskiella cystojenkinii]
MASKPCYVLKDKPLLPATVPTATPYGHADPVIRTYMDRYRRESAEQKYAQTGEYPRFIANLQALSPSVPDPSAPCQTKTASLSFSTFSDSSDSSFDVQQGDAGDARAKRRSNNKSVWGRTSNVFLGSREGQRSHISKNHVSRYFQENSRSHPFPLYAPTYNSDEEDDEDDNHDGYGEMRSRPQETVKEEAAIITQWPHHQQLLLQQQQEQEQQRQYSSDLKVEHRSPTSVKEAKAKLARMTAQAEEMKAKAAKPQGRIGGGPPTAVIPTIPTTIPPPARTNYGYNYNSVTTNNKYLSMKNPSLLPNPYLTSTSAPPAAAAAAATAIIRKQ